MSRRTLLKHSIAYLYQLHKDGLLNLRPEFQRDAIWPRPAKAYLIDTILTDQPIPLIFLQKTATLPTGRSGYAVVDGQQRLRAIFEFLNGELRLTKSLKKTWRNKKFADLSVSDQERIFEYALSIQELSGYSDAEVREIFVRMNKYVVKLSPQELRHALGRGRFHEFVEELGKWEFWRQHGVFSPLQIKRMRAVEFSAELAVLLLEGPQDKKRAINLYYGLYEESFPKKRFVEKKLKDYLDWIIKAIPNLLESRFRKPVDLYALVGALDKASDGNLSSRRLNPSRAGAALKVLEARIEAGEPTGEAARYALAASRQTDNIIPRMTRIGILQDAIAK